MALTIYINHWPIYSWFELFYNCDVGLVCVCVGGQRADAKSAKAGSAKVVKTVSNRKVDSRGGREEEHVPSSQPKAKGKGEKSTLLPLGHT
jgi:hypothetical protein